MHLEHMFYLPDIYVAKIFLLGKQVAFWTATMNQDVHKLDFKGVTCLVNPITFKTKKQLDRFYVGKNIRFL